jgi:hypothetical protein
MYVTSTWATSFNTPGAAQPLATCHVPRVKVHLLHIHHQALVGGMNAPLQGLPSPERSLTYTTSDASNLMNGMSVQHYRLRYAIAIMETALNWTEVRTLVHLHASQE